MTNQPESHPDETNESDESVDREIVENESPSTAVFGDVIQKESPPSHEDNTRRWLAYSLVGLLYVVVGVASAGWLMDRDNGDHLQNFAVVLSPVITLVGTMLGFYYRSEVDRRPRKR